MASHSKAEPLQLPLVRGVHIEAVFDDPDAVLALVRDRAPYRTTPAYHGLGGSAGRQDIAPWFRDHLEDDVFLHNPRFIAAAREAFGAAIVRPTRCQLNLYGPVSGGAAHLDVAAYRGISVKETPVWLLYVMAASGLFEPWMVPVASGLAWFYRGEGGDFEYWPGGKHAIVRSPPWNTGLICDNEYTWHRVGAVGTAEQQRHIAGKLRISDRLHAGDGGSWEIRDGDRLVERLEADQMRISILWKAEVFRDEAHLASFDDPAMDLDVDRVVEMFLKDLAERGTRADRPADPLTDETWQKLLQDTYRSPVN
jgi:hypothetical protein